MKSMAIGLFSFGLFMNSSNLNAGGKETGACYIKIYKTVSSPSGALQLKEDMTCEPLSLKKCRQKEHLLKMGKHVDDCHMHSWVEGERCGR